MEGIKTGDLVVIKSQNKGAEVIDIRNGKVTVKVATLDARSGRISIENIIADPSDLERLDASSGVVIL